MRRDIASNRQCALAKVLRGAIGSKSRNDLLFPVDNFGENVSHHQLRFVSRMSASSFDAARPLSMLSRARLAAHRRSPALPARWRAAAAFTTTRSRVTEK